MNWFTEKERSFATAISCLAYCNPFLEDRIQAEREALGSRYVDLGEVWRWRPDPQGNPNVERLHQEAEALVERLLRRLADGAVPTPEGARLYRDLVIYLLYSRYENRFYRLMEAGGKATRRPSFYRSFRDDFERYFLAAGRISAEVEAPHLFACFFQVRRAFHLIFDKILGGSKPAANLRSTVWQSIFTHDMRRYRRSLYLRMGDLTSLITGPSGTGKDLVAQAIGMARYIPFDGTANSFSENFESSFYPLNLSALSPTLIESELFGHRRGAFTGALDDRAGWLEVCPRFGTVFLDEIGEVDPAIQVKLLRVLQTRQFQRLGETQTRPFLGKIVAATNRDLRKEVTHGGLREDFYYRLCSDLIVTPCLAEQLTDSPEEIETLVLHLSRRIAGEEEGESVAREVLDYLRDHLPTEYAWPGNVRELEQCVRNVMIRGFYRPLPPAPEPGSEAAPDPLQEALARGTLTAEELLDAYTTRIYAETGNYLETGRRLGLDRRTVKARVDRELLARSRHER